MALRQRFDRSTAATHAARVLPIMAAVAAPALLSALPATPAQAQATGADLRVLSPRRGEALGSGTFLLDVAFQSRTKSPVTTAELWVDGVRWVHRDLDAPQTKNVLSFQMDASNLSEGEHSVVVKVFCASGAASSTQLTINAGSNGTGEGSFSGPQMTFLTPGNGKRVSGTVELMLDAPAKNGINPYITFYVDKQFKTLKNYPPYSYSWDSTTVPNGYHTVEAVGYLESANASTTRRMKVYVDNAGGNTTIKSDVPDLSAARQTPPATPTNVASTTLTLPLAKTAKRSASDVRSASVRRATATASSVAAAATFAPVGEPTLAASAALPNADVSLLGLAPVKTARRTIDARPMVPTIATAKVRRNVAPIGASVAPSTTASVQEMPLASVATLALAPHSAPVTVAPAFPAARRVAPAHVTRETRRVSRAFAAPPAQVVPLAPRTVRHSQGVPQTVAVKNNDAGIASLHHGKGVQVAFDGQQIAFDVQPRVEAGLPLAPFRQIFEHTGGQVMWVAGTRMVRAVNADREIVIAVGHNQAKVNGQSVTMAKPAYIENGRTIVPLSFVGQAMDVDVKYDPATGHIQITSK